MTTETLQTKDFGFDLPEELIAQTPIEPRDASRLMLLDKDTGEIEHKHFYDIIDYLRPGDCLVLNNSRVLPARIYGTKNRGAAMPMSGVIRNWKLIFSKRFLNWKHWRKTASRGQGLYIMQNSARSWPMLFPYTLQKIRPSGKPPQN